MPELSLSIEVLEADPVAVELGAGVAVTECDLAVPVESWLEMVVAVAVPPPPIMPWMPPKPEYVCMYAFTSVGSALNQLGDDPAAKAVWKELAKDWSWSTLLIKDLGAAVSRTESTDGVGKALASCWAKGPSWRRTAGSVGSAIPATEALHGCFFVNGYCIFQIVFLFFFLYVPS